MRALIAAAVAAFSAMAVSDAAEIKVISSNAMRDVIADTKAQFEAGTGHRLLITVIETGEIRKRVLAGQPYEVMIVPREVADEFEKAGKMVRGSAMRLTRISFGLAVPVDGPRPDISTPENLKRTLLAARTILITDPATGGVTGVHFMDVLNKLGIAEQMKDKLVSNPGGSFHARRVVQGEADFAVQAEHEIRCIKGAAFVPFPPMFQRTIVFVGGVGIPSDDAKAATDYLAFLTSAEIGNAYSAHCLPRG